MSETQIKEYPKADGIPVMCRYSEIVDTDTLTENPDNPNRHPSHQLERLAEIIQGTGWRQPITVSTLSGYIVKGHGRYKAAKLAGLRQVPIEWQDYESKEKEMADLIADNKIAAMAVIDETVLERELSKLAETPDFALTGFSPSELAEMTAIAQQNNPLSQPFTVLFSSILDTRRGAWIDRARAWHSLIGDEGQARAEANLIHGDFTAKYGGRTISILDPVLSETMTRWFTPAPGAKCFDVFAGDTIFGYVCSYLGMSFTGIELREEQAAFNNEQTRHLGARYICDDGRNVLNHIEPDSQDLLFSCPPYFDIEVYSDKENDASNQASYADFYAILDTAFSNAIKCLKKDRFAVIVVGDIRSKKDGSYYGFMEDVKQTFRKNGMCLYNEMVLVNVAGTMPIRARRAMRTRKVGKTHQNVLVFYKGDTNAIPKNFPTITHHKGETT